MKYLFTTLILTTCVCHSDEYRYNLIATTGLQERVLDKNDKDTTIVFSKKSNPKARHILSALITLQGIHGTKKRELWNGVTYEQAIILKGTLHPKIHRTQSGPNTAASEDYQEFILEDISVQFPLTRIVTSKGVEASHLETHFSFGTLFPDGIHFEGKKLDLDLHSTKSEHRSDGNP